MNKIQLPESTLCQNVSDKLADNKYDSKRSELENDVKEIIISSKSFKVFLDFPKERKKGELDDVKKILSNMLKTYITNSLYKQ